MNEWWMSKWRLWGCCGLTHWMEGGISRPRGLQCRTLSREGSPSPSIPGWVHPTVNPQEGHLSSVSSRPVRAGGQLCESTAARGGELEMDTWSQAHTWDFHAIPRTAISERQDKGSQQWAWCSRKIFSIIASLGVLCLIINVCSIFGLT